MTDHIFTEITKRYTQYSEGALTYGELMRWLVTELPPPATPPEADNVYGEFYRAAMSLPGRERTAERTLHGTITLQPGQQEQSCTITELDGSGYTVQLSCYEDDVNGIHLTARHGTIPNGRTITVVASRDPAKAAHAVTIAFTLAEIEHG